jgi:molybdenum cofactor cytidylyltransferase
MVPTTNDAAVGGVVLAAGLSTRYEGGNKLLEDVDGQSMVRHVGELATAADLDGAVAVTGHEAEAVESALDGLSLDTHHNAEYEEGQSTSVRAGVAHARSAGWDAAVFLLGDMPFIAPETVDSIVKAYRAGGASILAPRYDGMRGNPVLFDADHYDSLAAIGGDRGGRELLMESDDTQFVDTDDAGVLRDIDTEGDLAE